MLKEVYINNFLIFVDNNTDIDSYIKGTAASP